MLFVSALFTGLFVPGAASTVQAATPNNFSSDNFYQNWQRTDLPIAAQKTSRSWYWGPAPLAQGFYEYYEDAPFHQRVVQYFDKARMELNNPDQNSVTNGLLVVEMIRGKLQTGDNSFTDKDPANVPVAGDPNNAWPTYKDLNSIYNQPTGRQVGDKADQIFNPDGITDFNVYSSDPQTTIENVDNGFGIPAAFWDYLNRSGLVYNGYNYVNDTISSWIFSTGHPITDAYWTKVKVGGVDKYVLFQAFERRLLTYTPSNPSAYQVEMGNVGLHYVQWRYGGNLPQYSNLTDSMFGGIQPQWYSATDVLNIRTEPNSQSNHPESTTNHPYVQQLQPGDHVQVLKAVQGEEILPGNNVWYQIYENPNLYVYSGYMKKYDVPDYPRTPRTHSGIWVSVSLDKQMMAVFRDNQLLYKTLIASGRPGVGDKDYSTVRGVYSAIGGYRPLSQTMQGGSRASASYYNIDDIRYVTYFYRDYAIHGSYWHAKFGIAPQSHGCVNSTVYDASLVWRLPVGTVVDVF
ncbi:MAG TPA: L,D-transpeptidase [Chloroflexia bacterium]|nr:L,D-transpeptidase [Chloroflexia bacterium]